LIANRCKNEAECREEFGGTGIELGDYGGHIPLERAPEVAVRGSYENRAQSAQTGTRPSVMMLSKDSRLKTQTSSMVSWGRRR
jgi:hypothetical protein